MRSFLDGVVRACLAEVRILQLLLVAQNKQRHIGDSSSCVSSDSSTDNDNDDGDGAMLMMMVMMVMLMV